MFTEERETAGVRRAFGMTFSKNNWEYIWQRAYVRVDRTKTARSWWGVCSLWKLGYSSTAAGPAITLHLSAPTSRLCGPVSHKTTTTCVERIYKQLNFILLLLFTSRLPRTESTITKQLTVTENKNNWENTVPGVHSFSCYMWFKTLKKGTVHWEINVRSLSTSVLMGKVSFRSLQIISGASQQSGRCRILLSNWSRWGLI